MLNWSVFGNGYIAEQSVQNGNTYIDLAQATYNDIAIYPAFLAIANQQGREVITVQFDNDPPLYVPPYTGKTLRCIGKSRCRIINRGSLSIPIRVLDSRHTQQDIDDFTTSPINLSLSTNLLLMHFDGNMQTNDGFSNCAFETIGNITTSTAEKKFGSESLYIADGTSGLNIMPSNPYDMTSAFTLEMWIKAASGINDNDHIFTISNGYDYVRMYYIAAGFTFVIESSDFSFPTTFQQAVCDHSTFADWAHVYMSRSGDIFSFWINGVDTGITLSRGVNVNYNFTQLYLGKSPWGAGYNCYIDELRFKTGGLWTISPATVPSEAYQ